MRCFFYCLAGLTHLVAAVIIMYNTRDYNFALAQCAGGAFYVALGLWREIYHE